MYSVYSKLQIMPTSMFLKKFAADIVKRSGIARPTVEALLPHVFDEIRYRLTEASIPCVPIDGFGTFAVIDKPEHQYHYTYKGADKVKTIPAKKVIKFAPARNLRREVDAQKYDPERHSFWRHPADPPIRKRQHMQYQKGHPINARPIFKSVTDNE